MRGCCLRSRKPVWSLLSRVFNDRLAGSRNPMMPTRRFLHLQSHGPLAQFDRGTPRASGPIGRRQARHFDSAYVYKPTWIVMTILI